jgi:C4-dicarboxylate-specific signal transduction histidine kinase/integral membrane sensor domain MASE1
MLEPKSPRRTLWLAFGVAAAYYAGARLGFVLRFEPATTSVLWPPNALLTALLLLTPPARWWIVLASALPAHLLVEAQAGFPLSLMLALYATNCSEALLAAAMLRLWSDAPHRFDSVRRVTAFLAAAVLLAPFLTSFVDVAAIHWLRSEEYWPAFRRRFFSNALSALTIVPSVVAVVCGRIGWRRDATGSRRVEAALLSALVGGTALAVFAPSRAAAGSSLPGVPYTSLPFLVPALIWAAVRFGPEGASLALLATTLATIRAATLGWKPFGLLTPEDSVVALQVFITVVGVPLLYLGALIEERRRATSTLGERLRFEELLSRLSASFVHPASHQMDSAFESALEQLGRFVGVDRITLRRFTPAGKLNVAYAWQAPQAPAAPGDMDRAELPWAAERLWGKTPIVVSNVEDLPAEAATEQAHLRRYGIRALLVTPLVAGEQVIGGLGYVANSAPRTWSRTTVEQSRLIADVFANAMARKQAEDAVRSSEATKAAVLASLASHVAVLDRSGRILTVNESWARTSRDGPGDGLGDVGTNHLDLWAGLEARGLAEAREAMTGIRCVLGGSRQSFVLEYTCPAHPGIWYVMTVVPLRAPEGGAVVSLTDVTERKRAEIEAQKSRQELAHFLRVSTLGELTTSLAHELNQPLTAILANAQAASYLVEDSTAPAAPELREILADIAAEDRRAGEIIKRLRELLRKGEPERLPLDMNAVAREVLGLLSSDALLRGVSLRFDADERPLTVRGDRVQLQQVLLNLVINAMEAMAGLGADEAVVLVRAGTAGEDRAGLWVEDSGPGLRTTPPERLFEPFYTTKAHGLGMGLSIARSIVLAHGGTITAGNNPARGATFAVVLPFVNRDRATLAPEPGGNEFAFRGTGRARP